MQDRDTTNGVDRRLFLAGTSALTLLAGGSPAFARFLVADPQGVRIAEYHSSCRFVIASRVYATCDLIKVRNSGEPTSA
jgi:hypothetical protein